MDKSHVTLLALFDASSAFDMVDHDILLHRLEISFGLSGPPLLWFRSYLTDRTQMVILGDSRTSSVPVKFGVPQGSVLGPLLYIMFTADIPLLFAKHSASGHLYADDVQAFVHGSFSHQLALSQSIESLSADLNCWMSSNRLSLNSSKTRLIWLGTRQQLIKLDYDLLAKKFLQFTFSTNVRDLGVTLDSTLSFAAHISNLSRSSFYHLRRLRAIRRSVPSPIFSSMVHAFICSRIDYCNSLLIGLPKLRLVPLQSAAIARLPRFFHISTFMTEQLHWLPLTARIQFKVLFLT